MFDGEMLMELVEFFERSTLRIPVDQAQNLVQLDPDVK